MENTELTEPKENWDTIGRPAKALNPFFIEAMETVLKNKNDGTVNPVLLSNDAILIATNDILPKEHKASHCAFSYAMKTIKEDKETNPEIMLYVKRFQEVYKKALYKQESYIMERLQEDENKRQKWARILERKFKERNLKHLSEHNETKTTNHNYNINIIQPELPAGMDVLQPVEVIEGKTPNIPERMAKPVENLTAV